MIKVNIILKGIVLKARLVDDSFIGKAVCQMLPIACKINTWGDELYFPINLSKTLNTPVEVVNMGDIAYSKIFDSLCIFYGRTPIRDGLKIVPNGPVEIVGRLEEDPLTLKKLLSGYYKEKRRRIFNRVPGFLRFAETIRIQRV